MLKIEVLGPGCARCETLENNVRAAVQEKNLDAEVTKVTQISDIAARGVFMTPGLTVDGAVVATGRLLSVSQVKKILEAASAENG